MAKMLLPEWESRTNFQRCTPSFTDCAKLRPLCASFTDTYLVLSIACGFTKGVSVGVIQYWPLHFFGRDLNWDQNSRFGAVSETWDTQFSNRFGYKQTSLSLSKNLFFILINCPSLIGMARYIDIFTQKWSVFYLINVHVRNLHFQSETCMKIA